MLKIGRESKKLKDRQELSRRKRGRDNSSNLFLKFDIAYTSQNRTYMFFPSRQTLGNRHNLNWSRNTLVRICNHTSERKQKRLTADCHETETSVFATQIRSTFKIILIMQQQIEFSCVAWHSSRSYHYRC